MGGEGQNAFQSTERRETVKFIVKPKTRHKGPGGGKITLCAQCSENPYFCDNI